MIEVGRRQVLAILGAGLMTTGRASAASTPSEQIAQRLAQAQHDGKVYGLHTLLVSRGGTPIIEHYERGEDEAWGRPLGTVIFGPDVLHDLRSVSKSVVGLVYGIALAAGKVPSPEAKLYDQFPEYADLAKQPGRDRLTIHHVLSMTLGLEWDELTIPYGDLRNSENAMEAAPDRFRFILERPIINEPGAKWTYCGGATALLGRLMPRAPAISCMTMPVACYSIRWVLVLANGRSAAMGNREALRAYGCCRGTCSSSVRSSSRMACGTASDWSRANGLSAPPRQWS